MLDVNEKPCRLMPVTRFDEQISRSLLAVEGDEFFVNEREVLEINEFADIRQKGIE
jgi:hypothetical protein